MPRVKRPSRLFLFHLLTIILLLFVKYWIISGYPGPFQNNLKGGSARFNFTSCFHDNSCKFSSNNENISILLGDSEAESMKDLFYEKYQPHVEILSKPGCSFIPTELKHKDSIEVTNECAKLYEESLVRVKSLSSSSIHIYNRYTPKSSNELFLYLSFLQSLQQNQNKIIVIGQPIEILSKYSAYSSLIFSRAINTPSSISKSDFSHESIHYARKLQVAIHSLNNSSIKYINTEATICPAYPCQLIDESGNSMYADDTHLSSFGNLKLIDKL